MSNNELIESGKPFSKQPTSGLVSLTYIIYALHGFSALTGVMTPALVITAFLTGWPSIIAVILSYAKRSDAEGTYLESHFSWMISTFWYALLALVCAGILFITLVGIPVAILIIVLVGLWVLYRIIRGILALLSEQALPR